MNMNLDDLAHLLRNLMLSLGHANEMLPPRLSNVKAENARHINNAAAVLAISKPPHCHLHPMSTRKPRAPLPWERELDDVTSPQSAPRRCRVIRSVGGPVVTLEFPRQITWCTPPTRIPGSLNC
jgi:hypothetical protein